MTKRDLPANAKLIPEEAKQVFKGVIFDVYQWEQELFNGSHATFEMLKRPDTVLVVAMDENYQVIAMREEQSGSPVREARIPGGRVESTDESTLAAIQRELYEETGLTLGEWKFIEVTQPEVRIEWFIHVFIARGIESESEAERDGGEKIEVRRISYEELCEKNAHTSHADFFRKIKTTEGLKALFDAT